MTREQRRLLQLQRLDRWCLDNLPDVPYAAVLLLLVVLVVLLAAVIKRG